MRYNTGIKNAGNQHRKVWRDETGYIEQTLDRFVYYDFQTTLIGTEKCYIQKCRIGAPLDLSGDIVFQQKESGVKWLNRALILMGRPREQGEISRTDVVSLVDFLTGKLVTIWSKGGLKYVWFRNVDRL